MTLSMNSSTASLDREPEPLAWTSPSSPYQRRSSTGNETLDDLQDWFIDDNGNFLLLLPIAPPTPVQRRPLSRVMSRASVMSVATMNTVATAVPSFGVIDLSLEDVCNYIDDHRSLQSAEIVSTECYSERAGAVTHRFVILELRRPKRKDVWLRLDRRRGKNVSIMKFLATSGVTQANDRALLSAKKDLLVADGIRENKQVFDTPPNLQEFARLLRIITEEIVAYRIWPENCWFFCSLIQQHLEGSQTGWFVNGILKYSNLANDIRVRISSRVWQSRAASRPTTTANSTLSSRPDSVASTTLNSYTPTPTYYTDGRSQSTLPVDQPSGSLYNRSPRAPHSFIREPSPLPSRASSTVPTFVSPPPPQTSEDSSASLRASVQPRPEPWTGLSELCVSKLKEVVAEAGPDNADAKKQAEKCLDLMHKLGTVEPPITKTVEKRGDSLLSALDEVDTYLSDHGNNNDNILFREEMIRLQRVLFADTPISEQGDLARFLRNLGMALHREKRSAEACVADEEALFIRRENYRMRPSASRSRLASVLHGYAIHLHACKRYHESMVINGEAVELRKMLYELDPEEYRDALATSLENYNIRLGSCQRFEQAVMATEEALALRRIAFAKDPEGSKKDLADCLYNHGISLDDVGRVKEARLATEECNKLREELKAANPSGTKSDSDSGTGTEDSDTDDDGSSVASD